MASSNTFRFFFSGIKELRMVLISSSFDSRRGFTVLGSGAAPEEEDLSEEGMISSCEQAQ